MHREPRLACVCLASPRLACVSRARPLSLRLVPARPPSARRSNPLNPLDEWQLAVFYDVQTPQQIRDLTTLSDDDEHTTPSRVPVTIPGCSADASSGPLLCPLSTFLELVGRTVRAECITPRPLRSFAESLLYSAAGGDGGGSGGGDGSLTALALVAVAVGSLLAGMVLDRLLHRRTALRVQSGPASDAPEHVTTEMLVAAAAARWAAEDKDETPEVISTTAQAL